MKLILDSETLSINFKMTDVQEIFSEQPIPNGHTEDIKNGEVCYESPELKEGMNGINIENNKSKETEVPQEKAAIEVLQKKDKIDVEHMENNLTYEETQTSQNFKESDHEADISDALSNEPTETLNAEVVQSIEEPVKNPASLNDNSTLQENTTEMIDITTKIDGNPMAKDGFTSDESEVNKEQIIQLNEASSYTTEEIRPVKSVKVDESIEKETDVVVTKDNANICNHVETASDLVKVNGAIKTMSDTMVIDDTIKNETDTLVIDDSMKIEPGSVKILEDINNESDKKQLFYQNPDSALIDESIKSTTSEIGKVIKSESNAFEMVNKAMKVQEMVEIIPEQSNMQTAEAIENKTIQNSEATEKENTSDDLMVDIAESAQPVADQIGDPKDEVDKCAVLEKAVIETDFIASTDEAKDTFDVLKTPMETDCEESSNKAKEAFEITDADMETDTKESSDKQKEYFKVIETPMETDSTESSDKTEDTFRIIETAEVTDVQKPSDKSKENIEDVMEIDAKESSDKGEDNVETVKGVMETDAKESYDKIKNNSEVIEAVMETDARTEGSSNVSKDNFIVNKPSAETSAQEPSNRTATHSTHDEVTDTVNPAENTTGLKCNITVKKSEQVIEIDCTEKEQVIEIDKRDKDTVSKIESGTDAVFNCEDSSDGCTVVEAKENPTTENKQMDVDAPLENKESECTKSSSDVNMDAPSKPKSICGLSNTLDIISDDEDETPPKDISRSDIPEEGAKVQQPSMEDNKCINLDDDDDIMLIDEDPSKEGKNDLNTQVSEEHSPKNVELKEVSESSVVNEDNAASAKLEELLAHDKSGAVEDLKSPPMIDRETEAPIIAEKPKESDVKQVPDTKPLVPANFLKTFKSNVAEMTRDELEEFCLIKIVEGIVEKSNFSDIKVKLKTMAQNIEEWRKKAMMLTKQNRDLQIVLKTVQEEQKKKPDQPITPLKITRSVGMQVFMTEANERGVNGGKRGRPLAMSGLKTKPLVVQRQQPKPNNNPPIPVPRLVPATASSPVKPRPTSQLQSSAISSNSGKASPAASVKAPPVKIAEKRPLSSGSTSFTVDLTDDEPPAKQMAPRQAPVRVVSQQHLMAPRAQQLNNVNSPRKVYIPINSQTQNQLRPGNAITLKAVAAMGARHRPPMVRLPNNSLATVRTIRPVIGRHPAPLPDVAKQQQPPNWKALPPSPDLKISKVENGIVISWKIDGYQEDSYEEIASYQLYAYQETSSPPSTLLWKKIGDVKALPLPMACTLTQFMAGYKYYFAVRAVDIRSRIGPFSLPGSILLLNK